METFAPGKLMLERGVSPNTADVVFLPIDSAGSPGQLNEYVLAQFKLDTHILPDAISLRPGFAVREVLGITFVFVITVSDRAVATNLKRNLTAALAGIAFAPGSTVWIPLMGTGVGGLTQSQSLTAILEALVSAPSATLRAARVLISVAPGTTSTEYAVLRQLFKQITDAVPGNMGAVVSHGGPPPRGCLTHDRASHEDLIGFEPYALAIRKFLTSRETLGPISISIQAPWGAGKSSLMRQVRHLLDPTADNDNRTYVHASIRDVLQFLNRKRSTSHGVIRTVPSQSCLTVWFNAWKYESSEQVWAGLVDAIVGQISDRLPPVERELFLLRLNLARIDDNVVRSRIHNRVIASLWPATSAAALAGGVAQLGASALSLDTRATGAVIAVAICGWVWNAWARISREPASFSLSDYMKIPDYSKSVGVIHQIHRDLQRVVRLLPGAGPERDDARLVIFIDDLDRCSPGKVASIVEGINMLLASDQKHFLFVIGMDPQIVAAALEHAHKDIKSCLPVYEQSVPLGWRFMDKFIQFAFTIPPRSSQYLSRFVDLLVGSTSKTLEPGQDEVPRDGQVDEDLGAPDNPLPDIDTVALQEAASEEVTEESEDVLTLMRYILTQSPCSPREIKRALNVVRFALLMRVGRIALGLPVPSLPLYGRWITLSMRWPDMARWLQWSSDVVAPVLSCAGGENFAARRLAVLESAAVCGDGGDGGDHQSWCQLVAQRFGWEEGKVRWLDDPGLYRFFATEATFTEADRLSNAAAIGFY